MYFNKSMTPCFSRNGKGSSQYPLFNTQDRPFILNSDHQMLLWDAGLRSCQTYDQSFYSVTSTWYRHVSLWTDTARTPVPDTSCFTPESTCGTLWTATPAHCPLNAVWAGYLLCMEEQQPQQPPMPPHAPLALGTVPSTAKQLRSWQARAGERTHGGSASCTDWPTCHSQKAKWERRNHHRLKHRLFGWICTCLAAWMPSPPERGLLSIIRWSARQWSSH